MIPRGFENWACAVEGLDLLLLDLGLSVLMLEGPQVCTDVVLQETQRGEGANFNPEA